MKKNLKMRLSSVLVIGSLNFLNCGYVQSQSREYCYEIEAISERGFNLCTPLGILLTEDVKLNRPETLARGQVTSSSLDNLVLAACLDRQKKVEKCDKRPSLGK